NILHTPLHPELLCIFGTGDLGHSLGLCLLQSGYRVVYGSRRPHRCGPLPQGAQVMAHAEAAKCANLNFICVHHEHYEFLTTMDHHLQVKVSLVPKAAVVKGLNALSAWALQNGLLAGKRVYLCGESGGAKQVVAWMASKLAARELDDFPMKLFPEWRLPLLIAVGLSTFFFFYILIRDIIYAYVEKKNEISYRIMMSLTNKLNTCPKYLVFPIVALIMLSLCYLPGAIAAFFPLYRGTKYSVWLWCFPIWLDCWMLCRKQMDVVVLGYAFLHAIYTFIIPIRYAVRHKLILAVVDENIKTFPFYFDNTEAWGTDSFFHRESWDFFLFVLLGLTSLPSVGGSLSWREFMCMFALNLSSIGLHAALFGWLKVVLETELSNPVFLCHSSFNQITS
uniref:STEAP family member 4 n=1 Tax=Fundulus heteroclitus TaxID=8078 RepID=A0A3Q2QU17_FUNHE